MQRDVFEAQEKGERKFLIVVPRPPGLFDLAETSAGKAGQGNAIQTCKAGLRRACTGITMVGKVAALPALFQKAIGSVGGAFGVSAKLAETADVERTMRRCSWLQAMDLGCEAEGPCPGSAFGHSGHHRTVHSLKENRSALASP